jgi:Meckel syndrome type 1 protein
VRLWWVLQVASYDQWDRYRTQGYCYLDLDPSHVGSRTHYLRAWKPTGTVTDRMHTFFTGGAPELEDLSVVKKPAVRQPLPSRHPAA